MDILKGERSNEEKEDLVGRPADHLYERIVAHCAPDPLPEEQQLRKIVLAQEARKDPGLLFLRQNWIFWAKNGASAHFYAQMPTFTPLSINM